MVEYYQGGKIDCDKVVPYILLPTGRYPRHQWDSNHLSYCMGDKCDPV